MSSAASAGACAAAFLAAMRQWLALVATSFRHVICSPGFEALAAEATADAAAAIEIENPVFAIIIRGLVKQVANQVLVDAQQRYC